MVRSGGFDKTSRGPRDFQFFGPIHHKKNKIPKSLNIYRENNITHRIKH